MKVYFDASPRRLDEYKNKYKQIVEILEDLGHEMTSRWILDFDESFYDMPRKEWSQHYRKIMGEVERADVVVVDISVSSTSIGQIIQYSLMAKKPVVVLRDHHVESHLFLEGAGDVESKLIVVEYDLSNVEKKLKEAFLYVEEWMMESRFTLIVDGETRRLLDDAVERGESRSDYIRRLIRDDVRKMK